MRRITLDDMLVPEQIEALKVNEWDIDALNNGVGNHRTMEDAIQWLEDQSQGGEEEFYWILDNRFSKVKFSEAIQVDCSNPRMIAFIERIKSSELEDLMIEFQDDPMARLVCRYYSMK